MNRSLFPRFAAAAVFAALSTAIAPAHAAEEPVLNLYSARHYQTDEALYDNFTKATGIRINRIEAGDEQLLERIKSEGAMSPADILMIVDAARLWSAQQQGLFQPVKSATLNERIPASMRDPEGNWYGFSSRARVIVYNKATVKAADVPTYESLADPRNKGKICTRSGSHPYNLSLVASLIAHNGEAKTEEWAKAVVANMARTPRGGDTDQLKGVAAGECAIALSNTYYYVRLLRSGQARGKGVGFEDRRRLAGSGELRHARQHRRCRRVEERAASRERDQVPGVPRERPGAGLLRQRQQRMARREGRGGEESGAGIARHLQGRHPADRNARQEHARGADAARPRRLEVTAFVRR